MNNLIYKNQNNLNHLNAFVHFKDEYKEKPACRHGDECKSHIRMEQGDNQLNDQCHLKLYRHPPRKRNIKLAENMHSLIINTNKEQNHHVYEPTKNLYKKHGYNIYAGVGSDGFLKALIEEVKLNGFAYDLCLECAATDDCKHTDYSVLKIVNDKMMHIRHRVINAPLMRDHMLSLVLYTSGECNYDLCSSQRNGDYKKWKLFDYCLYWAIRTLSELECGSFSVFSGS
eukprot:291140_1